MVALVLLFLDQALARGVRAGLLAGGALSCAILAGHPQTLLYLLYAVVMYGCLQPAEWHQPAQIGRRACPTATGTVIGVLATGGLLAAVQILPSIGFILRSTRAGLDFAMSPMDSRCRS